MNIQRIILALLSITTLASAASKYELVWADEFNRDGAPDSTNWTHEHGHVRNHEAQWYQPDNAT